MIGWLAVFADVPGACVDAAAQFWTAVTATKRLPSPGGHGEFVPLAAPEEDPYLWIQEVHRGAGDGGWHLDLFVSDPGSAAAVAARLGARRVRGQPDLVTLETPAGQPFCLVSGRGGRFRAQPRQWPGGHSSLLDQVCLDLPSSVFEQDSRFWSALTAWELREAGLPEFSRLAVPAQLPLRILLQRLGDGDTGPARAHVDFSCDDVAAERLRHKGLGAEIERTAQHWVTMRDPAGLQYCITDRMPSR